MAACDGDVKLGTLGNGCDSSSESPTALALLTGRGGVVMLLNVALLALLLLGAYRLWVRRGRRGPGGRARAGEESPAASLPRMKKRDSAWSSCARATGTACRASCSTSMGKSSTKDSKFCGPAGPSIWNICWLGCLDKDALKDEYDDLSDLNAIQMESVRKWEMKFKEKSECVGRLLKPGDSKDHNKQD